MPRTQRYAKPPSCCNHCRFVMHFNYKDWYVCTNLNEVRSHHPAFGAAPVDDQATHLIRNPQDFRLDELTLFQRTLIENALQIPELRDHLQLLVNGIE